jgi:hypothetical protein
MTEQGVFSGLGGGFVGLQRRRRDPPSSQAFRRRLSPVLRRLGLGVELLVEFLTPNVLKRFNVQFGEGVLGGEDSGRYLLLAGILHPA